MHDVSTLHERLGTPVAGKDARTLARDLLVMTQGEFRVGFRGAPTKRARLRGLRRDAAVVLGNVGSAADLPALVIALSDAEPLVRSHAARALGRLACPAGAAALRERLVVEEDAAVRAELVAALDPALSTS